MTPRQIENALSPEQWVVVQQVVGEAESRRLPIYLVGGSVRDILMGKKIIDLDLVTEGDCIDMAKALQGRHGGRMTIHARFRTAQWHAPASHTGSGSLIIDLITARSETYKVPAALPTVKSGSLEDDLRRRDFTINTLALRLDGENSGELVDITGGVDDLQRGVIRVLHDGSFGDDPTRIFRAVRYEQRLGFHISKSSLALIPAALPLIRSLSAQRVRHELDLILTEQERYHMLARLHDLGALNNVHPSLVWNEEISNRFYRMPSPHGYTSGTGWIVWLMHLSINEINLLNARLGFSSGLLKALRGASGLFHSTSSLLGTKPSQATRMLDMIPLAAVEILSLCWDDEEKRKVLVQYLQTWRKMKPKTTGASLMRAGLKPGPQYQRILDRLRDAWLDGEVTSRREEMELLAAIQ